MKKILVIAAIIALIDQIIKNVVVFTMAFGDSVSVLADVFSITLLGNTGAAFSILSSGTIVLILISIVALNLIYWFFIKDKNLNKFQKYTYGVLIGGIIGNLVDRIFHGYVIDYLDFNIFGYNFPVFNFADICIVVSIALMIFDICKGDKNENTSD